MAVRSRSLALRESVQGQTWVDLFTVPQDRTLIVKHLAAVSFAGVTLDVRFGVRRASAGTTVIARYSIAAAASAGGSGLEVVLHETDVLTVWAQGATGTVALHVAASGALLVGDAS